MLSMSECALIDEGDVSGTVKPLGRLFGNSLERGIRQKWDFQTGNICSIE